MKFALSLIILSFSIPAMPHSAHAWGSRTMKEVSTEKLTLMGKPIENRATEEKIALACTTFKADTRDCMKMQFVIFKGQSAFLFGEEFILQEPHQLQGVLKETYKDLKKTVKYDMKSYWGGTAGVMLIVVAGGAAVVALSIAGASMGIVAVGGLAFMLGTGYADNFRSRFDLHAGIRNLTSGEQLDVTRTKDGWNWSINTQKVSAMKFYHYKRSIDIMMDGMIGSEGLNLEPTPPTQGQCRVNFVSYHQSEMYPSERMTAMSEILVAREMAAKHGCALTVFDRNAEYQLSIRISNRHRNLVMSNTKTGEILESASARCKNNDVKNDKKILEMLP